MTLEVVPQLEGSRNVLAPDARVPSSRTALISGVPLIVPKQPARPMGVSSASATTSDCSISHCDTVWEPNALVARAKTRTELPLP